MALKEAPSTHVAASLAVDLVAVLAAVTNSQPRVMTIRDGAALPSGPFELDDRSLQSGLREWVEQQLVVSVPAPHGGMISVVLNRHRRDFSDRQRELIDLLRPHLRQAAAIAALLSQPVPYTPRNGDGRALLTPRQTRILQLVAAGW